MPFAHPTVNGAADCSGGLDTPFRAGGSRLLLDFGGSWVAAAGNAGGAWGRFVPLVAGIELGAGPAKATCVC